MEKGPGSIGIHVGDHCVISFTPLPSAVCSPGKREANGDLFKHMRDPPQLGPAGQLVLFAKVYDVAPNGSESVNLGAWP